MNTPQRVDVARLSELLDKATPGPWRCTDGPAGYQHRVSSGDVDGETVCDVERTSADAALIVAMHEALPALLQQLAEQTRQLAKCFVLAGADTDGRNDASFAPDAVRAVNDLRHDYDEACNEAEKLRAKLAERDADVATLREAFALKHAAIILMRDVANGHKARAEAAERAREVAVRAVNWYADNQSMVTECNGNWFAVVGNRDEVVQCDNGLDAIVAAFLAANGGGRED